MYRDRYRDSAKKVDEGSMWYVAFYSYTIGSREKTNSVVLLIRSRWFEIDDFRASICQAILLHHVKYVKPSLAYHIVMACQNPCRVYRIP
jgi:hypothetical protein